MLVTHSHGTPRLRFAAAAGASSLRASPARALAAGAHSLCFSIRKVDQRAKRAESERWREGLARARSASGLPALTGNDAVTERNPDQ